MVREAVVRAIETMAKIRNCKVMLLTPSSVRRYWVWYEAGAAWRSSNPRLPVVAAGLNPEKTSVVKVMTKDLVVGHPKDDINDALQKMHSIGCRHLPVVDAGTLVGMISLRDLLEIDDDTQRKRAIFLNELVTYSPDYES